MRSILTFLVAGAVAAGCGSERAVRRVDTRSGERSSNLQRAIRPRPDPEIDRMIRSLSPDERAGQLVMTRVDGTAVDAALRRLLARQHIGGVILFEPNVRTHAQLRRMIRSMQSVARDASGVHAGILVAIDQEGGPIRILGDVPPGMSQRDMGRGGTVNSVRHEYRRAANALRRLGVNLNLAPVADLDLPPRRVMAGRSFGRNAGRTARLIGAAVRGTRDGRVGATVKHFPGLGGAGANSDDGIAVVARSRRQLRRDLEPFRAAVDAGVPVVMVSHGVYRGLGAREPATVAPQVIGPVLRGDLGFDGVAITDSMNAKGFRDAFGGTVPRACVAAVKAGIDVVLLTGSYETATLCRRRIARAVRSGDIPRERFGSAVRRVVALKRALGLV